MSETAPIEEIDQPKLHPLLGYVAHGLSLLFHPLLLVTYILLMLLMINPYLFGVHKTADQIPLVVLVFFSTFLMPVIAIVMMKTLGFIKSWDMRERTDRIVPYIATSVFYISTYYYLVKMPGIPVAFKMFMLGGLIALFLSFFINNFSKISIHTVGMGGLLAMTVITMSFFRQSSLLIDTWLFGPIRLSMLSVLILVILASGMVGTARLLLGAHEPRDLWGGYLIGICSQLIALQIVF